MIKRPDIIDTAQIRYIDDPAVFEQGTPINVLYVPIADVQNPRAIRELRSRVLKAIGRGQEIYSVRKPSHGDTFIHSSALAFSVRELRRQAGQGLPEPKFASYDQRLRFPKQYVDLTREALSSPIVEAYALPYHHYLFSAYLSMLALGIEPKTVDIPHTPLPMKADSGPLAVYDEKKISSKAGEIKNTQEKPIVVLTQGGSVPQKRFSNSQVLDIAEHTLGVLPDCEVVIVSDSAIMKTERVDVDINDMCAYYSIARTVIATDTLASWVAAGEIAKRPDRNGKLQESDMLTLYTLGSPTKWGIIGSNYVMSEALELFGKDDDFFEKKSGMIKASTYDDFFHHNELFKGIDQQDINETKEAIEELLIKPPS